jgi:hypothetical protein
LYDGIESRAEVYEEQPGVAPLMFHVFIRALSEPLDINEDRKNT